MALVFVILIVNIDINTYFHRKPFALGIYAKNDINLLVKFLSFDLLLP